MFFGAQLVISFIQYSLDCYLSEQNSLFTLFVSSEISEYLLPSKVFVSDALLNCDCIVNMHESLSDFRNVCLVALMMFLLMQAPEWIGSVLKHLINISVCSIAEVEAIIQVGLKTCLEDEYADKSAGKLAYARLKDVALLQ